MCGETSEESTNAAIPYWPIPIQSTNTEASGAWGLIPCRFVHPAVLPAMPYAQTRRHLFGCQCTMAAADASVKHLRPGSRGKHISEERNRSRRGGLEEMMPIERTTTARNDDSARRPANSSLSLTPLLLLKVPGICVSWTQQQPELRHALPVYKRSTTGGSSTLASPCVCVCAAKRHTTQDPPL